MRLSSRRARSSAARPRSCARRRSGAPPRTLRPRAATLDGSSVGALPETLSKLVAAMAGLPDDKYRYKQLLFWAAEAPDLAAGDKVDANKVPGCLSTVHVTAALDGDGRVVLAGDSDAQLTKGLVVLLVKGLSGATVEEICAVDRRFPHQVAGDAPVTTLDVIVYSFVMVAMSGLGGLPFFLLPGGLSKRSAGLANALAAGVMLSASYTMIYEGQVAGPKAAVSGLFLGAAFMRIGEGAGVGWRSRSTGEPSGFRRGGLVAVAIGAHNVPEGFGVALALITKGASPASASAWAVLTSAPQLVAAVPAFLFCETFSAIQPLAMGFGAGAMIVVVFGEMLPEALEDGR
ncbi:zinc ion transmembrane transporter [Aureococcus anophagefferens]|nr:zinc ion transmembrane transporter [Aureococcus anophagefferens]